MENKDVKIGMKVVPNNKSYAGELKNSIQWNKAIKRKQGFLYVNFIHDSRTFGNVFVLGIIQSKLVIAGDFFLASDFQPFE